MHRTRISLPKLMVISILVGLSVSMFFGRAIFFAQTTALPGPLNILSIPYFSTKGDWDSILTLGNSFNQPITVSVTLYSLDGSALPPSDLSVQPNRSATLRLSDIITRMRAEGKFQEGSVEVRFNGPRLAIGAQLTVSDLKHGVSFDMEPPLPNFKSSTLEGLWWSLDEKTSGQVMLSNTTSQSLTAQMNVQWRGVAILTQPLSLSSHQTIVLEVEKLLKDAGADTKGIERGGLSIVHSGSPGALIAHGVVLNKEGRFASNLNFIDPAAQKSSVLEATGLMLAHPSGPAF